MNVLIKALKRPWLILPFFLRKYGKSLEDEKYIKLMYYLRNGKNLNLESPETYFEKINWMKLHDRRPEYTMMVDKYEVKRYVAEKIGENYVVPMVGGPWESVEAIEWDNLPDSFVLKCTHDGGSTFLCKDKNSFDRDHVVKELKRSLDRNYYYLSREWPYKDVKPRIISEKYIPGIVDNNYKFFCFDGKVKFLYVAPYREATADYFDENFNHIDGIHNIFHDQAAIPPQKPDTFAEMKMLAEKLSEGYPEMRIDFYDDNGNVYFGEITFFQEGGFAPWIPDKWNHEFGQYIKLPEMKDYSDET